MGKKYPSTNPWTASCTLSATATTKCFSLSITGTTFENFGGLKTAINYPNFVDPNYKLKYSGSVVNLVDFYGEVLLQGNTFTSNVLKYTSCD
jgi:hypothetical protein